MAGLEASTVMPCVLDAGTHDVFVQQCPKYLGCRAPRLEGAALEQVNPFVPAIHKGHVSWNVRMASMSEWPV